VLEEQALEGRVGRQALVLLGRVELGEVPAEGGQPVGVALLPPDDGTVELPLGAALAALDPGPPRQLLGRAEGQEGGEAGLTSVTAREGPPGPDPGRVDEERAEQPVDVVGGAGGSSAGRALLIGGQEPLEGRIQRDALLRGQPGRNGGTLGPWPRRS
jgi:hypothetical protein